MNKIKRIIILLTLSLMLCACEEKQVAKEEVNLEVQISPSDQTIMELSTKIYTETELEEIARFTGNIEDLGKAYPIECIRGGDTYQISYLGEKQVAMLLYDNEGKHLMGRTYSIVKKRSDFSEITVGDTLEDVQAVDPNGFYMFFYTGINWPRISEHCTEDGYMIQIEYDRENVIIGITEWLI